MRKLRLRNSGLAKLPHQEEAEPEFRPDQVDSKGQILSTESFKTFLCHSAIWVLPGRGSRLLEDRGGRLAEQTVPGISLQRPNPLADRGRGREVLKAQKLVRM